MACCHPLKAFWTGCYTDDGKLDLVIMPATSGNFLHVKVAEKRGHHVSCNAPLVKMNNQPYLCDPIAIPCGTCVGCRMDRARAWKVRCVHEHQERKEGYFLTLTYDDAHLPINDDGEPYLERRDIQLFLKNWRHHCKDHDARYFGCSEYGDLFHRPHFHMLFWSHIDDLIPYSFGKWVSPSLAKAWRDFSGDCKPRGQVIVQEINPNSIAYVAGYTEKKQVDEHWFDYPVKPFLFMSTKPIIGHSALRNLDHSNRKVYGNFGNCHYSSIPKAYLKKCEDEPWFESFKDKSKLIAKSMAAVNDAVFCTLDEELQGFLMEEAFYGQLDKKRKPTL